MHKGSFFLVLTKQENTITGSVLLRRDGVGERQVVQILIYPVDTRQVWKNEPRDWVLASCK